MKCLLQRVQSASVKIDDHQVAAIKAGLVAFIGIEVNDSLTDIRKVVHKVIHLRIFSNKEGKFDYSLADIQGDLMVVSQFTLMADITKGRRPNFTSAANPKHANALCNAFIEEAKKASIGVVQAGEFAANMQVQLINDGPVTIPIDSAQL